MTLLVTQGRQSQRREENKKHKSHFHKYLIIHWYKSIIGSKKLFESAFFLFINHVVQGICSWCNRIYERLYLYSTNGSSCSERREKIESAVMDKFISVSQQFCCIHFEEGCSSDGIHWTILCFSGCGNTFQNKKFLRVYVCALLVFYIKYNKTK